MSAKADAICDSSALLRLRQHGALAKRHEVQQQSADQALLARAIASLYPKLSSQLEMQ